MELHPINLHTRHKWNIRNGGSAIAHDILQNVGELLALLLDLVDLVVGLGT